MEHKGTIILGDKVMVSDPCYGLNTWCQGVIENLKRGVYNCSAKYSDEDEFGIRIAAIEVTHQDFNDTPQYTPEDFEVGVDSGQAGIFDYEYYAKYHADSNMYNHVDDNWYAIACSKTSEYVTNPNYALFVDTPEYKAGILAYRCELDELAKKYPSLDTESAYMKLINDYNNLGKSDKSLDFNGLMSALQDVVDALNCKDNDKAATILKEIKEQTEGTTELHDIEHKYNMNLHKLFMSYMGSYLSCKNINRLAANTIDNLGFISSSGYGDGIYTCSTAKNEDGQIVAIKIEFISDDEE